jgi:hypothetical protein
MNIILETVDVYCKHNPIIASKKYDKLFNSWAPLKDPFDPEYSLQIKTSKIGSNDPFIESFKMFVKRENQRLNTPLQWISFSHLENCFKECVDLNSQGNLTLSRALSMISALDSLKKNAIQAAKQDIVLGQRECKLLIESLSSVSLFKEFDTAKTIFANWLQREYLPLCKPTLGLIGLPNSKEIFNQLLRGYCGSDAFDYKKVYEIGMNGIKECVKEQDKIIKNSGLSRKDFLKAFDSPINRFATKSQAIEYGAKLYKRFANQTLNTFNFPSKFVLPVFKVEENPLGALGHATTNPFWFYFNTAFWKTTKKSDMIPLFLHEGLPGHAFSLQVMQDCPNWYKIVKFGNVWESVALFAETLFDENDTLFEQFSRVNFKLWRALRCVVNVMIHIEGKSLEECLYFMKKFLPMSDQILKAEIDRYCVRPGKDCSYYTNFIVLQNACDLWLEKGKTKYQFFQALMDNCMFDIQTIFQRLVKGL